MLLLLKKHYVKTYNSVLYKSLSEVLLYVYIVAEPIILECLIINVVQAKITYIN